MKIAIVCSRLSYGGAERVAVLWANGFAERGYDVLLIAGQLEAKTYQVDDRVKLCNLFANSQNKIIKWGGAIINIRKIAQKESPDVIIGVMKTCSLVAKMGTIGMNIPIIMTEHNSFERPVSAPLSKNDYFFKYYVNRLYHHVTVLTTPDKEFIRDRLHRVSVLPNPLLLPPVEEIPSKERIILAAGRLDAWHVKGFDVLIKAFSKLVQGLRFKVQGPMQPSSEELIANSGGWKLQIAGTGSEKSLNYLKGLCKENGVEDYVEFLGFQKDIEKLYQKASIFVLSSRYEGFGLVLIEAMSQGCACIACDYKGRQREILCPDGHVSGSGFKDQSLNNGVEVCENGILCEPDNVNALVEAMRKMITDDQYRESVRMKAVERSKFYSLENTTQKWEKLLHTIVKKS